MLCGTKSTTAGGNMRAPQMAVYLQWIVDAWNSLPNDMIAKSFKVCGISNSLDGLEDDAIHCFKPDGPCPNGRTLLLNAMLDENIDEVALTCGIEEIDIGQDLENGCESDYSVEL